MSSEDKTLETYKNNFEIYKQKTPGVPSGEFVEWLNDFIKFLPKNAKVFEFGSAQGREARFLRNAGMDVFCTDIIPNALEELKNDNFNTCLYDFRDEIKNEWINEFDGVIAKAVFLHATEKVFLEAINNIIKILKQNGIVCLTFKLGVGEEIETEKLGGERYFKYYTKKELENIFNNFSELKILDISISEDKKWIQIILKKIIL